MTANKNVLIAVAILVCIPALMAAGRKDRPVSGGGRRAGKGTTQPPPQQPQQPSDCGPWVEAPCAAQNNATCGQGNKVWTRTGSNCPVSEKTFKCKIPCADDGAAKLCKYTKSPWSECNTATSTMTRTLTLKVKRRGGQSVDSACEPTKTVTKACRNAEPKVRPNRRGN